MQRFRAANLGRFYSRIGFLDEARLAATRSLAKNPSDAGAHLLLAESNRSRPRHEVAAASDFLPGPNVAAESLPKPISGKVIAYW